MRATLRMGQSSHGRGLRIIGPLIFVVAALLRGLISQGLHDDVASRRAEERAATELVRVVGVIDGLEWRAMADLDVDEIAERFEQIRGSLPSTLAQLEVVDPNLTEEVTGYVTAVQDLLNAISAGDLETAARIDETRVDPFYEEVVESAERAAAHANRAAEAVEDRVSSMTWLTAAGSGVLLALLSWIMLTVDQARTRAQASAEFNGRFRSLVENSRDLFTVVSGSDKVTLLSQTVGPLRGISTAEAPKTMTELIPAALYEEWATLDRRLIESSIPQSIDTVVERADGSTCFLQAEGALLSANERAWVWRDVSESKELEHELVHQAFHDSLTGVANRSLLEDRAAHALQLAARTGQTVSLLFCDLDNFKTVNDSLGHAKGDHLLKVITERLRACVRHSDTVARFGGDEFAILLEDASAEMARALAERIVDVIGYEISLDDRPFFPSVSIGVATSIPGTTTTDLLRNADTAMYAAKAAGKGRVQVFRDTMRESASTLLELQNDLRNALDGDQLVLHYQPTVALTDGHVEGVEALIRWNHPTKGTIPPGDFIPIAEATGSIIPIGKWVLTKACTDAVSLQHGRSTPLSMHVNLSPLQLRDPDLVTIVRSTLEATGLAPHLLVVEVTEGTLLDDHNAIERLRELHQVGVRIAVDDFGTGYTSITYLQQLPIDVLEIDRSFVSGDALPHDQRSAFLHTIIGLATSLGVHSVAEGVEAPAQLDELRQLGCQSGQGFFWSPAVDVAAVGALVDEIETERAALAEASSTPADHLR